MPPPLPDPKIVAFETSGRIGSVALARGPKLLCEHFFGQSMRHAAELMPTLQRLCQEQGWRPDEIDQIYVATGPGSFTGLRIAISVARAMSQAAGCRLVGVPTLDVLAQNAPPEVQNLVVVLDAKRGQVFAAQYVAQGSARVAAGSISVAEEVVGGANGALCGALVRVNGPVLTDPAAFVQAAANRSGSPVYILGEGIDYHRAALAAGGGGGGAIELDRTLWPGRASSVHKLGYAKALRGEFTPGDQLLPVYIRLAEAEEVWRKKRGLPF